MDKGLGVYKEAPKLLLLKAAIFRRKELYDEALDILERASKHMNFEHISEEVRIMIGLTYNDIGKALYKGASYD